MFVPESELGKTTASCCPTPQVGVTPLGAILVDGSKTSEAFDRVEFTYVESGAAEGEVETTAVYRGTTLLYTWTFTYNDDGLLVTATKS